MKSEENATADQDRNLMKNQKRDENGQVIAVKIGKCIHFCQYLRELTRQFLISDKRFGQVIWTARPLR